MAATESARGISGDRSNVDLKTVEGFGDEWNRFDQSELDGPEYREFFDRYFEIFPWDSLPPNAVGFDLGCGSGRWARGVLPRIGHLHLIDPSSALEVAQRTLASDRERCTFHRATVDAMPIPDASMDFGYSLGVLHHVPDTTAGIAAAVRTLKPGAPFLLYLYYALETRSIGYRALWRCSNLVRRGVSVLPPTLKHLVCDATAAMVYWPLARASRAARHLGVHEDALPLSFYRDASFYTMRTDALDRLGTRLESRFTRAEIERMMLNAGLVDIRFSERAPFWVAIGIRGESGPNSAP